MKAIQRSLTQRMAGGVCGGIAEQWDFDPNVVRVVAVFLTILTGLWPGIVAYGAAWYLMPEKSEVSDSE